MGHSIVALVSKEPIQEKKAMELDLPIFPSSQYVIVGLAAPHCDLWAEKASICFGSESTPITLDSPITHYFAKELGLKKYLLLQTNYLDGIGEQYAALFEEGRLMEYSESANAINEMLRLGVAKGSARDEFEAIGLHRHRSFDESFESYWDGYG
ncbi:MAG: hypothetical protein AAF704_13035 [Cyanobacteria bacterium P01_D01_bin.123]